MVYKNYNTQFNTIENDFQQCRGNVSKSEDKESVQLCSDSELFFTLPAEIDDGTLEFISQ